MIYKLYNTIDNFNLFSVEALKAEVRSAASEETAGDDPDAGAGGGSGLAAALPRCAIYYFLANLDGHILCAIPLVWGTWGTAPKFTVRPDRGT